MIDFLALIRIGFIPCGGRPNDDYYRICESVYRFRGFSGSIDGPTPTDFCSGQIGGNLQGGTVIVTSTDIEYAGYYLNIKRRRRKTTAEENGRSYFQKQKWLQNVFEIVFLGFVKQLQNYFFLQNV